MTPYGLRGASVNPGNSVVELNDDISPLSEVDNCCCSDPISMQETCITSTVINIINQTVSTAAVKEIILFSSVDHILISWDSTRVAKFGNAPLLDMYLRDTDGSYYKDSTIAPRVNAAPPDVATITYDFGTGATASGFIVIT